MIQRCNTTSPISQVTVLAILNATSLQVGETVLYTDSKGMSYQLPVIRVDNVANTVALQSPQGTIVVSQSQIKLFNQPWLATLPLSEWVITSFDPSLRVVCIDINNPSGVRHMTVTLPVTQT